MIEVTLPKLEEYQRAVLDYYIENPIGKTIVTISPRQVGKSTFLEVLLLYVGLTYPDSKSIAISPIFAQSRKLYEEICNFANKVIKKKNSSILEIEFINGSIVKFSSAEQGDNLRGFTCKKGGICVLDEAAFIKKDFYYNIVVPFTNVYRGDIFLFSTPKFKDGLLWELYNNDSVKVFEWKNWDLSRFLTQELLDLYRHQLPKLSFQSEYLAEFIDGQGTVFTDFRKNIGEYTLSKDKTLYISIDWGTGSGLDDTVLCYGQIDDRKLKISHLEYFNDKSPTNTIDYILNTIKTKINEGYRDFYITVEKNSIGKVYYDMLFEGIDSLETEYNDSHYLDEVTIDCNTFLTSNKSKKTCVEQLELLFEENLITIPNNEKLLKQLSMFEATVDKNSGTVYYKGANNSNDDCVLSLLFMVNRTYREITDVV